MSEDPLEKAILSGALAGQLQEKDPDAEPRRKEDFDDAGSGSSDIESESELVIDSGTTSSYAVGENKARKGVATQTGPKGVLQDFKDSKQEQRKTGSTPARKAEDDDSDLDGDEDEEATRAYIQRRMLEMKLGSGERNHSSGKHFGQLREINAVSFEKAVLEEEKGVKVIVHLYDPELARCMVLSHHLITLARDYPQCKFLIIEAADLDFASGSSDVVLPTLLVYQGGELIANLVAVDQAWGRQLDYRIDEIKRVLIEQDIIHLKHGETLRVSASIRDEDGDDLG